MSHWSDPWNALTAIGTTALAIATFLVIWQGHRQSKQTERQHQDRFKPICLLAPHNSVDWWDKRGKLIELVPPPPGGQLFSTVIVRCMMRNVGVGPALNLLAKLHFPKEKWTSEPWELSPLGAGQSYGSAGEPPLAIPILFPAGLHNVDSTMLENYSWEIWLEYEDVFGRKFRSIHSKARFDTDPSTFTSTKAGPGQQSKLIMQPIPWFTYIELSSS